MKLNKKVSGKLLSRKDITLNEEGGIAFRPNAKLELMLRTVSSLVSEDGFYKSGSELDEDLRNCIGTVAQDDPEYLLKLAYYARKDLYLRTAPIVLMGEYGILQTKSVPHSRRYIANTIQRADELTELAAYSLNRNKELGRKGKLPIVIKKGIAKAFNKFDAYQLGKYNRDGEVTLRDAMFMTHPKPKDEKQAEVFKQLAEETLAPPDTWEVLISTQGSTKENWEKIIPKMGYMALLRNMRNFLDKKVDMTPVLKVLTDPKQVAKSKQFPYRFLSAYKELAERADSSLELDALSDAAELSVANVPTFTGKTFVTCDISGSMTQTVSSKSKMRLNEIGCLFGAIMHKKNPESVISVFATEHVPISLSNRDSMFTNVNKMLKGDVRGYGTDAYKVMNYLIDNKIFVDRIVLFSDMQCYDGDVKAKNILAGYNRFTNADTNIYAGLQKYRKQVNKDVYVYSFDLSSYGTTQFPQEDKKVCLAGGFSDKILNFIPMFEKSHEDMLKTIESISL